MVKIYAARSMTGRVKEDVVLEAEADKKFFGAAGLIVLDPVTSEGVKKTKQALLSSKKAMDKLWPRDKSMIREAHVIVDFSPHTNSEGVKHEVGYGRYHLWKPIVRVFPTGQLPPPSSVAYFEDDAVVDSREEALEYILRVHGTWFKRFNWRVQMYRRCRLKALIYEVKEWFK